jgi:hypothetical protein
MQLPKVYADFNAIEYFSKETSIAELRLTGYGTIGSLARQNLRLKEGMKVLLFEPNDIECEAVIHFDALRRDPAGRLGEWVARLDHSTIRDSKEPDQESLDFPCIVCGHVFVWNSPSTLRNYREKCSTCGSSVMAPMAPP